MQTPIVDDLTEALNFLVDQPDYLDLKLDVKTLANTKHGRFTGDYYPLNTLVDYAAPVAVPNGRNPCGKSLTKRPTSPKWRRYRPWRCLRRHR